jgi:hypothetical protein
MIYKVLVTLLVMIAFIVCIGSMMIAAVCIKEKYRPEKTDGKLYLPAKIIIWFGTVEGVLIFIGGMFYSIYKKLW